MSWWRVARERMARGGWFEARTLFRLLVVVFAVFAFLKIADEVAEGETQDFDHAVLVWLREPGQPHVPTGPAWLPEVARDITALGSAGVLVLLTVLVAGALWLSRRRGLAGVLVAAAVGATFLSEIMKKFFDRERPDAAYQLMPVASMSFPSGHSTLSAAIYLLLGLMLAKASDRRRLKVYFLTVAAVVPFLVGLTRIYLGAHFPTDVAAGWCVGAGWAFAGALLAERVDRADRATS